jgi:hypothetical protein
MSKPLGANHTPSKSRRRSFSQANVDEVDLVTKLTYKSERQLARVCVYCSGPSSVLRTAARIYFARPPSAAQSGFRKKRVSYLSSGDLTIDGYYLST